MTDQQKAPVFVRDATGLVRAFGWFDAFWIVSLGFGSSVLTGLAFYLAYYYVVGAGIYSSIIAIALTLPLSFLVYWPIMQMSIAMPRSGGDYIFVSRTIHPSIGFMNNFMFTVAALIGIGISIPYVISLALTAPLYVYGLQTGNTALSNIANAAGQPVTAFVLGTLLLLVIFGVMTFGSRALKAFNRFQLAIFIIASGVLFYVLLAYNTTNFNTVFNSLAPQTNVTTDKVVTVARSTGWTGPNNGFSGVLFALPIAIFTYYGASFSAYFAGELKNIKRTQPIATLFFMVSSAIYWILLIFLVTRLFSEQFFSAVSWITFGPGGSSTPFSILMPPQALLFMLNPPLQLLFSAFVVINWLQWFVFFWMAASRNMFAWSFDRLLPARLSQVNERFRSPIITALVVLAFAELFQYLFLFSTLFTGQFNFLLFLTSALVIPNLAAAIFPYRKKELFNSSPRIVRTMVGPIPLITILGIAGAIVMIVNTIIMLQLPFLGPANFGAFAFFFGIYIVGFVLFFVLVAVRKRQGIDLQRAYQEIPPE